MMNRHPRPAYAGSGPAMPVSAARVLSILHRWHDWDSGYLWASRRKLASLIGKCLRTITNAFRWLRENCYIETEQRGPGCLRIRLLRTRPMQPIPQDAAPETVARWRAYCARWMPRAKTDAQGNRRGFLTRRPRASLPAPDCRAFATHPHRGAISETQKQQTAANGPEMTNAGPQSLRDAPASGATAPPAFARESAAEAHQPTGAGDSGDAPSPEAPYPPKAQPACHADAAANAAALAALGLPRRFALSLAHHPRAAVTYAARRWRELASPPRNPLAWFTAAIRGNWHDQDTAQRRAAEQEREERRVWAKRRAQDRDRARDEADAERIAARIAGMDRDQRQQYARAAVVALALARDQEPAALMAQVRAEGAGSPTLRAALLARLDQEAAP